MRTRFLLLAFAPLLVPGCIKNDEEPAPPPTPEQVVQMQALRKDAIADLEARMGRSLTAQEKSCVEVRIEGGNFKVFTNRPLSDEITQRQKELEARRQRPATTQSSVTPQ
jgi:hypothetical protein